MACPYSIYRRSVCFKNAVSEFDECGVPIPGDVLWNFPSSLHYNAEFAIYFTIMRIPHFVKTTSAYTIRRMEVMRMSKPRKAPLGARNIVGAKVYRVRQQKGILQKDLAAMLQSRGMDICTTSLSRLEGQERLVQDFEIPILAEALGVTVEWLLDQEQQ